MISGYVGCDKCYWGKDGLRDTVLYLREHDYQAYLSGEFYTKHEPKEEEEC